MYNFPSQLLIAAIEYKKLQDRAKHPDGTFDKQGRWYPDEQSDCCKAIRSPSRAYPYSYMVHCRTANHLAEQYGIEASAIRKAAKMLG